MRKSLSWTSPGDGNRGGESDCFAVRRRWIDVGPGAKAGEEYRIRQTKCNS